MLIVNLSCTDKEKQVELKIAVKSNTGEFIKGAEIHLDGKEVGVTDNAGEWSQAIRLPAGSRKRIEISKQSETSYFAPDFLDFSVEDTENQIVTYKSTLFSVPKPSIEANKIPLNNASKEEPTKTKDLASDFKNTPQEKEVTLPPTKKAKKKASLPKVVLNKVKNTPTTTPRKKTTSKAPKTIVTIHVKKGKTPIKEASVFTSSDNDKTPTLGCTTNQRGRCVLRFKTKPTTPLSFIVKKAGYLTQKRTVRVKNKSILKFHLEKGETIDIYALTKRYSYEKGLKGLEVYVDGKMIGLTDKLGHLSFAQKSTHGDLMEVLIKSNKEYLPEEYETDFVVSGPMTLKKYFSPKRPPAVKISLLPIQFAGTVKEGAVSKEGNKKIEKILTRSIQKELFTKIAFKEVKQLTIDRYMKKESLSLSHILKKGWNNSALKNKVDALIIPTILSKEKTIELSIMDSKGIILAAAKADFNKIDDKVNFDSTINNIANKIAANYPFEGAILSKSNGKYIVNIGAQSARFIKKGDHFFVYGIQSSKKGQNKTHRKIATLLVDRVMERSSSCSLLNSIPRSIIERGDQVILKRRSSRLATQEKNPSYISILGKNRSGKTTPLQNANVYYNKNWIGATDQNGRIYYKNSSYNGIGFLKVIKHGYSSFNEAKNLAVNKKITITLKQETAFVRIESTPSGVTVTLDGKVIGKTPISQPVAVPTGFVKLKLKGAAGFKDYQEILELDQGTLELTGSRKVTLERDLMSSANQYLARNKIEKAVAQYQKIPETHSDYLFAQHKLGEIYLTHYKKPAMAAAYFSKITQSPNVADFSDKRFIGSHIDEGIALFMTAENLVKSDKQTAIKHYAKAAEVLSKTIPYLRFVPKKQYARAVHNVKFYRALSRHKIWSLTKDKEMLVDVFKNWRDYLEGEAKLTPLKEEGDAFIENANIYMKQAKASMDKSSIKF